MKIKVLLSITISLFAMQLSYGQENTTLSNLVSPTTVNQSLLPNTDNTKNLGNNSKSWKNIYIDGSLYVGGVRFLYNPGTENTFVGATGNTENIGVGNSFFGYNAGRFNATGDYNTAVGTGTMFSNTIGDYNTAYGYDALYFLTSGSGNTAIGHRALYQTTGSGNTASGNEALHLNTTGSDNTATGNAALYSNTTGHSNTATGKLALNSNFSGIYSTATGFQALYSNITGDYNTANGHMALYSNTTGSNNTGLGYSANVSTGGLTNATAIGANSYVSANNSLVLGSINGVNGAMDDVNVGIGTTSPTSRLEVVGNTKTSNLQMTLGASNGYVLQSDASGNASWVSPTTIEGATGPAGPAGADGINGINGVDGVDGVVGATGPIGATGPAGIDGNDGVDGAVGPAGTDGLNGIDGVDGAVGAIGPMGPAGAAGSANISGTSQYLVRFTGATSGGNSLIFDNGTNIGIGTNSPLTKFQVVGGDATLNGVTIGLGGGAVSTNTATGNTALYSNTTGYDNTANGNFALQSNSTGFYNTANGSNSLHFNTIGNYNTANGYFALYYNNGDQNTGSGTYALYSAASGNENTATGYAALYSKTSGSKNTATGSGALYNNTTGSKNTGLGCSANVSVGGLTNATAIGANAYVSSSNSLVLGSINGVNGATNDVNIGIGTTSPSSRLDVVGTTKTTNLQMTSGAASGYILQSDGTGNAAWVNSTTLAIEETDPKVGSETTNKVPKWDGETLIDGLIFDDGDNIGIGTITPSAKLEIAGGDAKINEVTVGLGGGAIPTNTAIGENALYFNTIGYYNTASGTQALYLNTTGVSNVAYGVLALGKNTDGYQNTAIGTYSLGDNTIGLNNTAIGLNALYSNTTGSNNTGLGYSANVSTGDLTNATAIGNNAIVDASNKVRIGNGSVSSIGGEVTWTAYSDARIKDNVQENVPGLEFINQLRPITYHFNVTKQNQLEGISDTMQWEGKYDIEEIQWTGFLAQEVDAAAQKIDYDFSGVDKSGKLMGLRYAEFVVPLVKATQELDAVNNNQDELIANQRTEIDELKLQIAALTSAINSTGLNDGEAIIRINGTDNAMLGQNIPNPFDNTTLIPFRIPKGCKDASIMISDVALGKVITVIPISCTQTHISFEAGELPGGTYTYSLIVDGNIIDTKQMTLTY